jgi:hypothetical protein
VGANSAAVSQAVLTLCVSLQITINRPEKRNAFTPRTGKSCLQVQGFDLPGRHCLRSLAVLASEIAGVSFSEGLRQRTTLHVVHGL